MNIFTSIPIVSNIIDKGLDVVDKLVPDKDLAFKIKSEIKQQISEQDYKKEIAEIQAQAGIITAEAQGDSWLQKNWRPLLMLWFAGLVGAYWLGFTAPNLPEEAVIALLGIVKVGIGGYVVGRTAEKTMKTWKEMK